MNMKIKPYEKYKEIDLPWLERIPSHWYQIRNKNLLAIKDDRVGLEHGGYTLLSLTKKGIIKRDMENPQGKFPKEFNTYKVVSKNDIIFCLFDIDETPRTVGLSNFQGMITGAYDIFSIENINRRYYYYYYLHLDDFKMMKPLYTGLRKTININRFLRLLTPCPPKDEQNKIADFLDNKLEKIDKFIDLKTRQIELLIEQKEAMINKAVTKGLVGNDDLKDSRVKWIGKMPKYWNKNKISRIFLNIGSGTTPSSSNQKYYKDGKVNWINSGDLKKKYIYKSKKKITGEAIEEFSTLKIYPENTIVIAMYGATIGNLSIMKMEGCMNQACCALSDIRDGLNEEYFYYALIAAKKHLIESGRGGGQPNISQDIIKQTWMLIPDYTTQKNIAEFIKKEARKIDETIDLYKKEIDLIKEYRTSLISSSVTGKIDIREFEEVQS